MELSKEQSKAAKAVSAWYKSSQQVFFLSGSAGTGKSTLVSSLLSDFDEFIMVAPTGKAAAILGEKTGLPVQTIHSLLYTPNQNIDHTLMALQEELMQNPNDEKLKKKVENYAAKQESVSFSSKRLRISPTTVLIIDEASMVGGRIRDDLVATGAKILFIGDQAQLPPVKDEAVFHNAKKDAVLTEVHRQAFDSPILRMATQVRNSEKIDMLDYREGDCQMLYVDEIGTDVWLGADQIITDTNASRYKINRFIRKQKGYGELTVHEGEDLICIKNSWKKDPVLINGVKAKALGGFKRMDDLCGIVHMRYGITEFSCLIASNPFDKNYGSKRFIPWTELDGIEQFDYGYALTVHKSQGSEFEKVLFADSKGLLNTYQNNQNSRQMLYTAITRASKQFAWIIK
jgi:exodeoxyribonuclease V